MKETRILVVGGYGAVGREIVKLLANKPDIKTIIGGRNKIKAEMLAESLDCEWRVVDLDSPESIKVALLEIDIVINCYLPADDYHIELAKLAIEAGVHYLDINPFIGYSERITELDQAAREKEVTLITALGASPGIPGLLILDAKNYFSEINSANVYFAMGGKLDGLTPLAIVGVDYMMKVVPKIWNQKQWEKAKMTGIKERMGEPFNKSVGFYPGMITYDFFALPEMMKIGKIAYWSGMENAFQGLVMFFGSKLGLGKNIGRAKKFLKLLLFLGKGKNNHPDTVVKVVVEGKIEGVRKKRAIELHETEDFLTALILVLACEQIVHSQITQRGAFAGSQVVDTTKLIESLKDCEIGYKESWD